MGWSDLGCMGGEIETPNLDALAKTGLRFTQFYNTARCCPTRASLLSGLYPHQARIGHMTSDQKLPGYRGDLGRNCLTIAEAVRPAGYRTYMCGKWHVTRCDGPDGPKHNWPLQRGFDKFYGTIKGGGSFYDPTSLCRGNTFITPQNDAEYKPDTFYYTNAITDNAVKFLKEHEQESPDRPFFLYVAYTAAHWPMHALEQDVAKYKGKYDGGYTPVRQARVRRLEELGLLPPAWTISPPAGDWGKVENKAWETRCMEVYAAMVDCMDQGIGRIVGELRRQGRFEKTLIFFLQDNGGCAEGMGRTAPKLPFPTDLRPLGPDELQPQIWPPMRTRDGRPVRTGPGVMPGPADTYIAYGQAWANVSNTPFREYKHWVHEGGIATPLIAHWPQGTARLADRAGPTARRSMPEGDLVDAPAHLIDIMATCVDLSGTEYPQERDGQPLTPLEGISLRPVFEGRPLARAKPIFFEHEGNRAIRDGRWKLVAKSPGGRWELYDMAQDRTEMHDLAAAQPERVTAMVAAWEAWAQRALAVPWPWEPPYNSHPPFRSLPR